MWDVSDILRTLDLASVIVFSITGALVASRKQMDIVGFLWLGVVTGVGGGTLRDLFLSVPVFWVVDATPLVLCLMAAAVVHFSAPYIASRYGLLLYFDAFGMALVTNVGILAFSRLRSLQCGFAEAVIRVLADQCELVSVCPNPSDLRPCRVDATRPEQRRASA